MTWYCVIDCPTFRILYHGNDAQAAADIGTARTYTATANRYGTALSNAAIGAGYQRRGVPVPEIQAREYDAE